MLASRWLRLDPRPAGERKKYLLERVVDVFYRPIERVYMRILAYVIDRRWIVVIAAFATLGSCVPLVQGGAQGLPAQERRGASSRSTCARPRGPAWRRRALAAERIARAVREWPEVTATLMTIGDNTRRRQTWRRSSCASCRPTSAS